MLLRFAVPRAGSTPKHPEVVMKQNVVALAASTPIVTCVAAVTCLADKVKGHLVADLQFSTI